MGLSGGEKRMNFDLPHSAVKLVEERDRKEIRSPTARVSVRWKRRWPLVFFVIGLVWGGLFPSRIWLALLTGWGVMLVVAYLWVRLLARHTTWRRSLRQGIMVVGDRLIEAFEVENRAKVPILWADIVDHSDMPGYTANRVEAVDAYGHKRWETSGTCQRRGVFRLGPWEVVSGDPLGLCEVRWQFVDTRTVVVYPRIVRLPPLTLPRGHAGGNTRERRPTQVTDVMVAGVRAYRPGDPWRHIHWRTTAHRGNLMSRLFEMEPSGDVWLVLDLDARVQAGEGERSTEEYMVMLAASLAARLLHEGRAVGVLWAGQQPVRVPPQAGTGHLWYLLSWLARARSAADVTLATLLRRATPLLGRGRTLVVFTPSAEADWVPALVEVRRRGLAATVVWLDRRTFMGEVSPTRTPPFASHLIHAQIPWHTITAAFPLEVTLKLRRRRTEYRVLPGTGRVVQVEVVEEV